MMKDIYYETEADDKTKGGGKESIDVCTVQILVDSGRHDDSGGGDGGGRVALRL